MTTFAQAPRPTWDETFIDLCHEIAKRSKDKSTQLGAVIVGPSHEIRSTGYNSFPRGVDDDREDRQQRPLKYKWFAHAEENAICNAARIGVSVENCILYNKWHPCSTCARLIINAGIKVVVIEIARVPERWYYDFFQAALMFKESEVLVRLPCRFKDPNIDDMNKLVIEPNSLERVPDESVAS